MPNISKWKKCIYHNSRKKTAAAPGIISAGTRPTRQTVARKRAIHPFYRFLRIFEVPGSASESAFRTRGNMSQIVV